VQAVIFASSSEELGQRCGTHGYSWCCRVTVSEFTCLVQAGGISHVRFSLTLSSSFLYIPMGSELV